MSFSCFALFHALQIPSPSPLQEPKAGYEVGSLKDMHVLSYAFSLSLW